MADVFISYAREDRTQAEQVARGLAAMGLDVFWDIDIPPGRTWADYTEEKLSQSKAMIVLWTANSTKSQWVREEARMGRDKGTLIPVLLDGAPAPFGFGEVQAANLSTWRGEANHPDWVRFANAVDAVVRGPNAPPRPLAQAAPAAGAGWRSAAPQAAAGGAWRDAAAPAEDLSPIGYIVKCFRLYFSGAGRARRMEYWSFALLQVVLLIAAVSVDIAVFGLNSYTGAANSYLVTGVVMLGLLCPGISVTARRFHDVGLSGWLVLPAYLLVYAFGIGALIILVVSLIPSKAGDNKYGPNPKAA